MSPMFRASAFLLLIASAAGQQWTGERVKRLESAMEAERARQGIVGFSVSVARGGVPRWSAAFGKADLEHEAHATPATLFRTASIAKPLTAVAALQLMERGKLDIDLPIQKYLPAYPEKPWPITTRQLLAHTSGTRAYKDEEMDSTRRYTSVIEALKIFSADALLHPPRTKYLYSTYGYNVAGAIVEAVSGIPFLSYVRENVLTPAKMDATRDDDAREIIPNRTRWYSKAKEGKVINAVLSDVSNKIPGGGLLSTSDDLIRFANSWQQEKLLKRETMRMQTERQRLADNSQTGYGLGWNVSPVLGRNAISHSGSQHGTRTLLAIFPELRLTVAVMTNCDFAEPTRIVEIVIKEIEASNGVGGVVTGANKRP